MLEASDQYEQSLKVDSDGISYGCNDGKSMAGYWYDDSIFLEASLQFEKEIEHFPIVSDRQIDHEVRQAVPLKTRKQTSWCMNVWSAWCTNRLDRATCIEEKPPRLLDMDEEMMCKWIGKFVYEARKANGTVNLFINLCVGFRDTCVKMDRPI